MYTREVKLVEPIIHHQLSEGLVIETAVGQESSSNKDISDQCADLDLERLAALFPANSFRRQAVEKPDTAIDLELDLGHLSFDGLCLANQRSIFRLVPIDARFQVCNLVLHSLGVCLGV